MIPTVAYSDTDKRAARFFADPTLVDLVREAREYTGEPTIRFHAGDFERAIDEPDSSFDLLISQYAGFVSRAAKRFVRIGGHLVVNNSHGDASMASLDPDWRLVAVYRRRGERFTFSDADLKTYMVPKRGEPPTETELESSMRGPAFTRSVAGYVFERIGYTHVLRPIHSRCTLCCTLQCTRRSLCSRSRSTRTSVRYRSSAPESRPS
jgi:hypothetical protein